MHRLLLRRSEFFDEPNEYRVLRLVRDSHVISRTEISQRCRLSKPTVSEIVSRFLKEGFLETAGESSSTQHGGRKRVLLRFNPSAGFVIGVDVRMTECIVAVTDLNARIIARKSFQYVSGSSPGTVLVQAFDIIDSLLATNASFLSKNVGIGIGLPGLIDRSTGIIQVADTLAGWKGTNIRERFRERFGLPVYVENDVKARALGEFLFGVGKHVRDQIFLWIGDGIGAGIIIDGRLHHGITESAGEIGYNEIRNETIREQFPLLHTGGDQRDFGDVLSTSVLTRRYRELVPTAKSVTVDGIFRAAEAGEEIALQLLDEVASLTSLVCINLINTLNPELIVIGGQVVEAGSIVLDRVQQRVREDILSVPAEAVRILPTALKEDGVILGAVGLVLYDLFKPVRNGSNAPQPQVLKEL